MTQKEHNEDLVAGLQAILNAWEHCSAFSRGDAAWQENARRQLVDLRDALGDGRLDVVAAWEQVAPEVRGYLRTELRTGIESLVEALSPEASDGAGEKQDESEEVKSSTVAEGVEPSSVLPPYVAGGVISPTLEPGAVQWVGYTNQILTGAHKHYCEQAEDIKAKCVALESVNAQLRDKVEGTELCRNIKLRHYIAENERLCDKVHRLSAYIGSTQGSTMAPGDRIGEFIWWCRQCGEVTVHKIERSQKVECDKLACCVCGDVWTIADGMGPTILPDPAKRSDATGQGKASTRDEPRLDGYQPQEAGAPKDTWLPTTADTMGQGEPSLQERSVAAAERTAMALERAAAGNEVAVKIMQEREPKDDACREAVMNVKPACSCPFTRMPPKSTDIAQSGLSRVHQKLTAAMERKALEAGDYAKLMVHVDQTSSVPPVLVFSVGGVQHEAELVAFTHGATRPGSPPLAKRSHEATYGVRRAPKASASGPEANA